ncbi:MAG TPA: LPS export ABC transporter periplasmic protein LptC [Thermoanaerobaculia bacterium]|nr:LPS export ABC transporter periplasmic protein LptC [Thermoanaerobaculia bacterium]
MQRTIRILKIVIPIAFFGFVLLLVFSFNRRKIPDKAATEPVLTNRPGKAQVESKIFDDTQTIAGRIAMHIHAQRVVSFVGGWNTLEDVSLTIYRPTGLQYQILCPNAEFNSATKEANLKGGVKVTSSDGVEVTTAEMHYDGNRLTNKIPVQFKIDRWTGNAGGLDMDVPAETLRLFAKLNATMTPETKDEAMMTIASEEGTFRRKENDVTFEQHVVVTRAADRLNCDHAVGKFTIDRKRLMALEGNGHVLMVMAAVANPGENLGGQKEITCERFNSEIGPDGQISALNAFGDAGIAHAIIEGPPKRDVVANRFRVSLVNRAVNDMKADDHVVMKELGPVTRQVTGDHLTVLFDQATHKATSSIVEGNFKYHDPTHDATAMRANYDIVNDRVVLTADQGFDPTVVSEGDTLKAKLIEFSPKGQTAKATGEVIAQLASKPGKASASADSTNIFPANRPVFINSDSLLMRQANKVSVFSGNVRAWQDYNTVMCQEMTVTGAGDTITARGNVRMTLYEESDTAKKAPILASSDQLLARKTERRADMTGNVKMNDATHSMTSEKSAFFFDTNKKLDHVESEGKIVLIEKATNRKGTGDKAIYQVAKHLAYITGNPATATDPTGTLTGQQIKFDLARNKVEVVSPTSQTQGTYKPSQ